MITSNNNNVTQKSAPNEEPSSEGIIPTFRKAQQVTANLSYLAAAKEQLTPSALRFFRKPSDKKPDINCRQSEAAISSPKFIPLIHKTESSDSSVTYTIPIEHRYLQVDFLSKIRQEFPYSRNELSIKMALASEEIYKLVVQNPVFLRDIIFLAVRTIHFSLTRFNFSRVPIEPPTETRGTIQNFFPDTAK
ncbi:hypothetical protein BY458DRAFT_569239 [Sporodiniella umbellata]|nr:hypothetical protein BY458DRAFT_569239 [Sporodiniella umbellata]